MSDRRVCLVELWWFLSRKWSFKAGCVWSSKKLGRFGFKSWLSEWIELWVNPIQPLLLTNEVKCHSTMDLCTKSDWIPFISRQKGCSSTAAASTSTLRASRKRKISKSCVSTTDPTQQTHYAIHSRWFSFNLTFGFLLAHKVAQSNLSKIIFFCAIARNSRPTHRTPKRVEFHVRLLKSTGKKLGGDEKLLRSQECKPRRTIAPFFVHSIRKFNR